MIKCSDTMSSHRKQGTSTVGFSSASVITFLRRVKWVLRLKWLYQHNLHQYTHVPRNAAQHNITTPLGHWPTSIQLIMNISDQDHSFPWLKNIWPRPRQYHEVICKGGIKPWILTKVDDLKIFEIEILSAPFTLLYSSFGLLWYKGRFLMQDVLKSWSLGTNHPEFLFRSSKRKSLMRNDQFLVFYNDEWLENNLDPISAMIFYSRPAIIDQINNKQRARKLLKANKI